MRAIRQAMDAIALNRENGKLSEQGKNGFKLTKQEIKTMPEHIRKIFIANNYIVNYRITSNGYFEARIRRKGLYVEASGRDFETMRRRFLDRLSACYTAIAAPEEPAKEERTAKTVLFADYAREWLKIKDDPKAAIAETQWDGQVVCGNSLWLLYGNHAYAYSLEDGELLEDVELTGASGNYCNAV